MQDISEPQPENCPICMCTMGPYMTDEDEIAALRCRHHYHHACILEWIQTATSCPYCRTEFATIDVLHDLDGPVIRTYNVEPKVQVEPLLGDAEEEEEDDPESLNLAEWSSNGIAAGCQICGSHEREDILMVCDYCEDCYHSFCLGVELPSGPFFCPSCSSGIESILGGPENPALRTVSSVRSARSILRRGPRRRTQALGQDAFATWREAWQRVATRAWTRLNAELAYLPEPEARLTPAQEDELRMWRTRMERRPYPQGSSAKEVLDVPDSQSASLWAAFEQAKNIAEAAGSTRSRRSRDSPDAIGPSTTMQVPHGTGAQRQKRPIARKRRNEDRDEGDHGRRPRKLSDAARTAKSSTTDSPKVGLLSSLLQSIKEPRHEEPAVSLVPLNPFPTRPLRHTSPLSSSSSSSSSTSNSPQCSPRQSPNSPGLADAGGPRYSKHDLSRRVATHLAPLYKVKLSKEAFTSINKQVTRRLFDDGCVATMDEDALGHRIEREIKSELRHF